VQGSLEPIINSLEDIGKQQKEINVNILHAETGNVTESDVILAAASDADVSSRRLADTEGVSIRIYEIIYRLLEDVEKALKGLLEPEMVEKQIGRANVLAMFKVSKHGTAAGCRVIDGELKRNAHVRVLRDNKAIFTGEMASLKREKEDVRDVREGMECGVALKGFSEFEIGDVLECFVIEKFGG